MGNSTEDKKGREYVKRWARGSLLHVSVLGSLLSVVSPMPPLERTLSSKF